MDWWALGVIIYECLIGFVCILTFHNKDRYAPFSCQSTADTCMMIVDWKQTLEFPAEDECDITDTAIDLICSLITSRQERIGYTELVAHSWLKGTDVANVRSQKGTTFPYVDLLH